jgi:asparagine synthase (glutamine-hydrolysing)
MKRFAGMARFPDVMVGYTITMMLFDSSLLNDLFVEIPKMADTPQRWLCPSRTNPVESALALDRITYLPGDLLTKVDRCSMLHALEVRSPFMDHDLVSFAAGLTSRQLLRGRPKRMLREAFADDLPGWVFKRKKMGFAVPIGEWFRGPLRDMLRDCLFATDSFAASHFRKPLLKKLVDDHETQAADHSQRLYALLMLELWHRSVR